MDWKELLQDPNIIATLINIALGTVIGAVGAMLSQFWSARRQRYRITYSQKIEESFINSQEQLREKLLLSYNNEKVTKLFLFSLQLTNTGKRTIRNQSFTCIFANGSESIDEDFPKITTDPIREVGPVKLDKTVSVSNEYRYTIQTLGIGHTVNINFLTKNNQSGKFEVIFAPNNEAEVEFIKGEFTRIDTLSDHVISMFVHIIILWLLLQMLDNIFAYASIGEFYLALAQVFVFTFLLPFIIRLATSLKQVVKYWQGEKNKHRVSVKDSENLVIQIGEENNLTQNPSKEE